MASSGDKRDKVSCFVWLNFTHENWFTIGFSDQPKCRSEREKTKGVDFRPFQVSRKNDQSQIRGRQRSQWGTERLRSVVESRLG